MTAIIILIATDTSSRNVGTIAGFVRTCSESSGQFKK